MSQNLPVFDLHCDLLSYLHMADDASIHSEDVIGASYPFLKKGNVQLQVCAIFSLTQSGSYAFANAQLKHFSQLIEGPEFSAGRSEVEIRKAQEENKPAIFASIENASGLLEEEEPISLLEERLDEFIKGTGRLLYISFTHHLANRFGGGNFSDNLPITSDGKSLLACMDGKNIAVDLSHTSDALAEGILTEIEQQRYDIPVIASHSNFRPICDHPRNLPDEFAKEIVHRKGLIGINFVRDFVGRKGAEMLYEHIQYGIEEIGAGEHLAFGADYFDERMIPDQERRPFFYPQHKNASKFPAILEEMKEKGFSQDQLEKISHKNAEDFIRRLG
ncbi:MAG: membrane dipeptidase [Bacteroidia bacterium]|nr:membrane dipeptidase [Bacteroidia bacterium]